MSHPLPRSLNTYKSIRRVFMDLISWSTSSSSNTSCNVKSPRSNRSLTGLCVLCWQSESYA